MENVYCIWCGTGFLCTTISGVDSFVSIRKLLGSNFKLLPILVRRWEIPACKEFLFHKDYFTSYGVACFVMLTYFRIYIYYSDEYQASVGKYPMWRRVRILPP
jgi:hypothetical protein